MKECVLVTFALPSESARFRRRLAELKRTSGGALPQYEGMLHDQRVLVVHTGVGKDSTRAVLEGVNAEAVRRVVACGFAGALVPELRTGECFYAGNFSTLPVGQGMKAVKIVTVDKAAESVEEKRRLQELSGAEAVDMETEWIAEWAAAKGLPMLAMRVVSDDVWSELPVPFAVCFDVDRQRPAVGRLVWFLMRHPARIVPFVRFVNGIGMAAENLSEGLCVTMRSWEW